MTKLSDGTSTSVSTSSASRRATNAGNDTAPVIVARLATRLYRGSRMSASEGLEGLLAEQIAYYRACAPEYWTA